MAAPGHVESGGDMTPNDTKPIIVKIEKENDTLNLAPPTELCTVSRPSLTKPSKRARVTKDDVKNDIETDETPSSPFKVQNQSDGLRVSQLEAEVVRLRNQILVNQQAAERVVGDMQRDWEYMRQNLINCQVQVNGLIVRMDRVDRHVDEVVGHLPGHHSWRSDYGSDFDPDATLAEVEFEDGSQPIDEWIHSHDWSEELEGETKGNETAV
ncbi:hypothetical protein B0H12DRAFT_1078486 [Mycena haematopus]|nr:hypothetical protein B0H12DRAFT_1078486 [Mycena haematopus]